VAALQLLAFVVDEKKKTSDIFPVFKPLPQILVNVKFTDLKKDPPNAHL
jgi:hypothetical protein